MCTLAAYVGCNAAVPLVVAANRDELYERPAAAPALLQRDPWIVGGRDLVAGGTWLGINEYGVAAGVLNRRTDTALDPQRRSRGHLCLDALRLPTAIAAAAAVAAEPGTRYNPFNLLVADAHAAFVVGNGSGVMRLTRLDPGVHVLTNLDLNDMECPRLANSYGMFVAAAAVIKAAAVDAISDRLRAILADHSTPLDPRATVPPNNLCVHGERFGTRSSTILIYDRADGGFAMRHADGPPCVTPYEAVALPRPGSQLDKRQASR